MVNDRLEQLTDRERACLRLVGQGLSSKEIAVELGISHHTVDLYLKRSLKALGVASRREAARLLRQADANSHSQQLGIQPAALAQPVPIAVIPAPIRTEPASRFRVPFLRQGRQINDLTTVQRLVWIAVLAVAALFVIANFFNGLAALFAITE